MRGRNRIRRRHGRDGREREVHVLPRCGGDRGLRRPDARRPHARNPGGASRGRQRPFQGDPAAGEMGCRSRRAWPSERRSPGAIPGAGVRQGPGHADLDGPLVRRQHLPSAACRPGRTGKNASRCEHRPDPLGQPSGACLLRRQGSRGARQLALRHEGTGHVPERLGQDGRTSDVSRELRFHRRCGASHLPPAGRAVAPLHRALHRALRRGTLHGLLQFPGGQSGDRVTAPSGTCSSGSRPAVPPTRRS